MINEAKRDDQELIEFTLLLNTKTRRMLPVFPEPRKFCVIKSKVKKFYKKRGAKISDRAKEMNNSSLFITK